MTVTAKNDRELTLYYDSQSELGKKCRVVAESSGAQVLTVDLSRTKLTGTEWAELAGMLEVGIIDLIDQEHPIFKELYGDEKVDVDENDALKILENNPETLVFPIAIRGNRAIQAKNASAVSKLADPDSSGVAQP